MSNNILHWYCKSRNYEISNGLHIELRYLATAACRLGCKAAKVLLGLFFGWTESRRVVVLHKMPPVCAVGKP